MKRTACAAAVAASACIAPAHAQLAQGQMQSVCFQNFVVEGTQRVTAVNFRTFRDFPNLDQRKALGNLRSAMLAEGFSNIGVDAVFMIQAGQTADSSYVRTAICRVVDAANL